MTPNKSLQPTRKLPRADEAQRSESEQGSKYPIDIASETCYFRSMKRKYTAKYQMSERRNDDFVPGTPAYRLSLVWPLTREIASMSKKHDAERRLQRHVTRLIRREG